jgi:hypothetical protein
MTFELHEFPGTVRLLATERGLRVQSVGPDVEIGRRETWPAEAIASPGGWRAAIEIEQLLELGLASTEGRAVEIPYGNFDAIEDAEVVLTACWTPGCPFMLRVDRYSDLGRPDFAYKYEFMTSARPLCLDRLGYYVRDPGEGLVFRLDRQAYALVEAMDHFNSLPPAAKTQQESWLTFAKVKGCAEEVGAQLDRTLQSNTVIVPSSIGLDIYEDEAGAITFLPRCREVDGTDFHHVFERNAEAQGLYSIDRPGLHRIRVVLTDRQREVLRRMKRVHRLTGPQRASVKENPAQVFDGVIDSVDLPYGERVVGIGEFQFAPTPKAAAPDGGMAPLWNESGGAEPGEFEHKQDTSGTAPSSGANRTMPANTEGSPPSVITEAGSVAADNTDQPGTSEIPIEDQERHRRQYLLIETNEETVRPESIADAERAASAPRNAAFERPAALSGEITLQDHQIEGVRWLQTCCRVPDRRGVLLADDMGLGKTLQVLSFLAWGIETGQFPGVSAECPPYRPILLIVPLILLENRTWESEMERFFDGGGSVFMPVLNLHGDKLRWLRAESDSPGRETEIGRPILDLDRLQRYRVVITNYETITNYQHSFAYLHRGKPLWSAIVTDEAQEYKTPNTRISHAIKALKADFGIASTGTPVENRLLDLWNLFDSLQPGLLRSAQEFRKQYEDPILTGDADGDLENLKRTLLFQQPHAFLLRRDKSHVASLPPKTVVKVECKMSAEEIACHKELIRRMKGRDGRSRHLAALQDFSRLYQHPFLLKSEAEEASPQELIAGSSKLQAVLDVLHRIRAKGEKAIIFTRHRAMQSILAKVLQTEFGIPIRIINGLTQRATVSTSLLPASSRKDILEEFRSRTGYNVLILSPHVAGVGLTITEANHVIHYGRWWNPAVESQATDRVYRIGQTKDVFVYLPIMKDPSGAVATTFDERLDVLMEKKYRVAENFLKPLDTEDDLGEHLYSELQSEHLD